VNRVSSRAQSFTESVIRGMTRLAQQHDAVNLAQGLPDFAAPEEIKQAAQQAVAADINQYAITWGSPSLRRAIAAKTSRSQGRRSTPRPK
jgi:aspartate/methionine/tyrosine aminotransferase